MNDGEPAETMADDNAILEAIARNHAEVMGRFDEVKKLVDVISTQTGQTELDIREMKGDIRELKTDVHELQSSVAQIETKLDRHGTRIEALEAQP